MRRYKSEKVGDFKMGVMDVIKYNGRPDVFAWKYPGEELGTWSQLVVNQSQEAVLVKGGSVADVFGPGTHTLDTKNIPILNKIINLPFGGKSPFKAEVWYINKDITWILSGERQHRFRSRIQSMEYLFRYARMEHLEFM